MIKDLQAGDPALVGPYRMLGRLGAGGMGQVYLGKSPGGRLVAIKLIRPELAEERGFRTRFSSEITAAKNVSGIYTAAVVDADADGEVPWMATVYVPGPSLTDAVEESGPLPVASVLALAGGLAEALGAIHSVGLVHRDLKPSNVLLASDGPRVIDFGISLALERSMLTTTGMVMGSPGFMSPEQARGQREVGAPTDVFSLGAVLAYAATGDNPFGRGPTPALLYRVVNEVPDLETVPARLSLLIGQCLEKDPASRPTPAEVLALLGDDVGVLSGEWLPPSVTQTMVRYNPPPTGPSGHAGPAPTVADLPAPRPATGPATGTAAGRRPLPDTAVVPVPGAATTAGRGAYGTAGGLLAGEPPYRRPPSRARRWRWPALAAAAAVVVVAVVAVLLTARSHAGAPRVNPTASLAGDATKAPTPARSATPSAAPATATRPATQAASQAASSAPASQASPTSSPAQSASPTPTASPTQSATSAPTQGASSSPASAPTQTQPSSQPSAQSSTQAPTTSPSGSQASNPGAGSTGPSSAPSGSMSP